MEAETRAWILMPRGKQVIDQHMLSFSLALSKGQNITKHTLLGYTAFHRTTAKLSGLIASAVIGLASVSAAEVEKNRASQPYGAKDFRPGLLWMDNKGVPIDAHGGGVLFYQGRYYWFGEHKVGGDAGNYAQVGVHCYSSSDLYNWEDAGIALEVSSDPKSEIAKGCIIERPKVIYNAGTGKFVMWFHLELKNQGYTAARTAVAVADAPAGPTPMCDPCA